MITASVNTNGSVALLGNQGTTWRLGLEFYQDVDRTTPLILTGRMLRGQYRKDYRSSSAIIFDFIITVDEIDVVDNPSGNKATLFVAPATSSAVSVLSGVYDIELYDPDDVNYVERIMQGTLTISPEVTK